MSSPTPSTSSPTPSTSSPTQFEAWKQGQPGFLRTENACRTGKRCCDTLMDLLDASVVTSDLQGVKEFQGLWLTSVVSSVLSKPLLSDNTHRNFTYRCSPGFPGAPHHSWNLYFVPPSSMQSRWGSGALTCHRICVSLRFLSWTRVLIVFRF